MRAGAPAPSVRRMIERLAARPVAALWLLTVLPFAVLPLTFLSGLVVPHEALWGHAVFHLLYLPVIALALGTVRRILATSSSRVVSVLLVLLLVALVAALFGHVGELVVTAMEGLFSAPESVFEDHRHVFFANFAVLGLMAAVVLGIAGSIAIAVVRTRARRSGAGVPTPV